MTQGVWGLGNVARSQGESHQGGRLTVGTGPRGSRAGESCGEAGEAGPAGDPWGSPRRTRAA